MSFCYGCCREGGEFSPSGVPPRAWGHLVIQNIAVTDKPAGHWNRPEIESNSSNLLKMRPDKKAQKAISCKIGPLEGARVRDEGVSVRMWVGCTA